ncbi:MAG: hypothetical protein J5958_06165 [Clostridia bacterium]|nr:hypothetical protein [Clostridia bacterium]
MEECAPIRSVDTRECRNVKSVEKAILFALASARAEGSHIVKIRHGERRIVQLRPFLRALLRKGEIRLYIEGTKLGDENDPGTLYLMANFASETADPDFFTKSAEITVVCV